MKGEHFGMQCFVSTAGGAGVDETDVEAVVMHDTCVSSFSTTLRVVLLRCMLVDGAIIRAPIIDLCETPVPNGVELDGQVVVRGLVPPEIERLAMRYKIRIVAAVVTRARLLEIQDNPRITITCGDVADEEIREWGSDYMLHSEIAREL